MHQSKCKPERQDKLRYLQRISTHQMTDCSGLNYSLNHNKSNWALCQLPRSELLVLHHIRRTGSVVVISHRRWSFHLCPVAGTRIIYDRKFLLDRRNSPIAQTPPAHLPIIPGVTSQNVLRENQKNEANNHINNHDGKPTNGKSGLRQRVTDLGHRKCFTQSLTQAFLCEADSDDGVAQ